MEDLKRKIEAFLFIISEGLKSYELAEKTGASEKEVKLALKELKEEFSNRNSALKILNYKELYRMSVDRNLITGVSTLVPQEFSKSLIKTLSVIAWKNGVTQGEIVRIRGNKAYEHISKLNELGFISLEQFGRTYKVTLLNRFYEYFNISKGEEKFIFDETNQ